MATLLANEAITISHIAYLGGIADTGPGSMHNKTADGSRLHPGAEAISSSPASASTTPTDSPTSGTITGLNILHNGASAYKFTNFHMSVSQAVSIAIFPRPLFRHRPRSSAGADHFTGSNFGDVLAGFGGNDFLNGRGGVDRLTGGPATTLSSAAPAMTS